jgi:hypothetical protein
VSHGPSPAKVWETSAGPPADEPPSLASLAPLGTQAADCFCPSRPRCEFLPSGVLFAPPLANPNEPRFFAKATSLENEVTSDTVDTAIGALIPVWRCNFSDAERDAFQVDAFAVVFNRWRATRDSIAVDYRVGLPLTWARGPWEFKLSYEHNSTHLGDEFVVSSGRLYVPHVRDEIIVGAGYRFLDAFRVYALYGHAFHLQTVGPDNASRYDVGLEWNHPGCTGWRGRPYAAIDLEFRGDQNLVANFTSQLGWLWRAYDYGPSIRLGLEYFDGRSPYGQFFFDRESWIGFGVYVGY